jgi:hypothetical protein
MDIDGEDDRPSFSWAAEHHAALSPVVGTVYLEIDGDVRDRLAHNGIRPDFGRNPALAMECTVELIKVVNKIGSTTYGTWRDVVVPLVIDAVLANWGLVPETAERRAPGRS